MRRFIWPVLSLALAASVQGNFPGYLEIMGARPDLVLVVLIAFALAE